jgi:hypothetical protein
MSAPARDAWLESSDVMDSEPAGRFRAPDYREVSLAVRLTGVNDTGNY